jgi:hypothetical protein
MAHDRLAGRLGRRPGVLVNDLSRVQIYNGLVSSGFAQIGVRVALGAAEEDLAAADAEWQRRRHETLRQLDGLPVVPAAGGWSLLLESPLSNSTVSRSPTACSSRRSPMTSSKRAVNAAAAVRSSTAIDPPSGPDNSTRATPFLPHRSGACRDTNSNANLPSGCANTRS